MKNHDKIPEDMGNETKKSLPLLQKLRYGRAISFDIFKKNAWLLIVIVVLVLSLTGMRYKTKTNMETITRLRIELNRAKSDKVNQKASYMTLIRESEMIRMTREKNLNLQFQDKPPYELTDEP